MKFEDYRREIAMLGREVNLDTVMATRKLTAPLLDVAPFAGVSILRDLQYGDHERQRLDIFTGEGAENRPLLLFVHGGGFISGDKYSPGTPYYDNIGVWAVNHGFNAVNMTYRLAPGYRYPSGIEDIHRAIQWLKKNLPEQGLGSDGIFLMGQSAGAAHASAYLAHPEVYTPDANALSGIILVSGLYNFESMQVSELERAYLGDDESVYGARSSISGLVATDLPMLVAVSEYDPPFFEAQALELLNRYQAQHSRMPPFVHLSGQNHMSSVLYLGLEGDLLGPQLQHFILDHSPS